MNCDYCKEPLDYNANLLQYKIVSDTHGDVVGYHTECERLVSDVARCNAMHRSLCHLDGCDWVAPRVDSVTLTS